MRLTVNQVISALLLGLAVFNGARARSQDRGGTPSLGEVARRLKAERQKDKQKPATVYTNDNLPGENSVGIATPKTNASEKQQTPPEGTNGMAASTSGKHGEKYFRSRADKIRARLQLHRRQLAVLQQELGLGKMQYYPNPQKTLEQESTPAFQSDIDKLRSKIADKQNQISADEKAMECLQEELRRQSGNPGWIR